MSGEQISNIHPEVANPQKEKEADSTAAARWLSGAFEAGGTILFHTQTRKNGHVSSYPFIAFNEKNEEFIDQLAKEFGGVKAKRRNSWVWRFTDIKRLI